MNKTILLAGALLAGHPAFAAAPPPVPADEAAAPAPQRTRFDHGELLATAIGAAHDLGALLEPDDMLAKALANYRQFEHSPATRRNLQAVFGDQRPFEFSGAAAGKGATRYRFGFPARG